MKKDQKTDFLSARVRYIPINDIRPNPQQPRRRFDSESLQELAASIAAYGILQPITVRQPGCGRCPVCWPGWMRRTPPCWP